MKIAVSANAPLLRLHLSNAVLERPELSLRVLPFAEVTAARQFGASAVLLEHSVTMTPVEEARISDLARALPVLFVAHGVDRARAARCLRLGSRGVVLADRSTRTLQFALFSVLEGGSWIDPHILSVLLNASGPELSDVVSSSNVASRYSGCAAPELATRSSVNSNLAGESTVDVQLTEQSDGPRGGLTGREWEVAALVGRGLTNGEIAAALGVDESTVKTHIGSILRKLRLKGRLQIALWVHRLPIG